MYNGVELAFTHLNPLQVSSDIWLQGWIYEEYSQRSILLKVVHSSAQEYHVCECTNVLVECQKFNTER